MATYLFECDECGHRDEIIRSMKSPPRTRKCKLCHCAMRRVYGERVHSSGTRWAKPRECMELGVPPACIDDELRRNPSQEFNRSTGAAIFRDTRSADATIRYVNKR